MTRKERRELAKKIAKLEKQTTENNMSENMDKMEELITSASLDDLLKIDEILMKKYLTN